MNLSDRDVSPIPEWQLAIRARCFHPSGGWVEFTRAEIEQSIPARFAEQVRAYGSRPAISQGGREWTYDQVNRASNRVARAILAQRGDGPEPVALLAADGAALTIALLGVLKAGKFYLPLNRQDPVARLTQILDDAQAGLLLVDDASLAAAQQVAGARQVVHLGALPVTRPDDDLSVSIAPDAYAYLIYTSGSTGQPKGVLESHRNVLHCAQAYNHAFHLCPDDRLAALSTLSSSGITFAIFNGLLNGCCLSFFDVAQAGVESLVGWLERERITICDSVPAIWRRLAEILPVAERFPSLRLVSMGGDQLYPEDVAHIRRLVPASCLVRNGYSASEVKTISGFFIDDERLAGLPAVPVGFPSPNTQVQLVDEAGQEAAPGEIGEIRVKGRYLSPGYWRRPDLTAQAFSVALDDPTVRMYRTGDLGRWLPDGALLHLGRIDSQVKIGGQRVELADVEAALRSIEGVHELAVIARSLPDGERSLHAYVVLDPHCRLAAADLRRQARDRLPAYMIPARATFLDALPINANGKVDRLALQRLDPNRLDLIDTTGPRTVLEQLLLAYWRASLGIAQAGVHADFFALGGSSLQATSLINQVKPLFGADLTVAALFEAPTVAAFATYLADRWPEVTAMIQEFSEIDVENGEPCHDHPPHFRRTAAAGVATGHLRQESPSDGRPGRLPVG